MKLRMTQLIGTVLMASLMAAGAQAESQNNEQLLQEPPSVAMTPEQLMERMSNSQRINGYLQKNLSYLERTSRPAPVEGEEIAIEL